MLLVGWDLHTKIHMGLHQACPNQYIHLGWAPNCGPCLFSSLYKLGCIGERKYPNLTHLPNLGPW